MSKVDWIEGIPTEEGFYWVYWKIKEEYQVLKAHACKSTESARMHFTHEVSPGRNWIVRWPEEIKERCWFALRDTSYPASPKIEDKK